ncbi:MAG TPA: zinc-binding dehydrogenase [Cytophagales bacterium]|nr:zinc-binding dehydrogenase [Cytophagales bacterium]
MAASLKNIHTIGQQRKVLSKLFSLIDAGRLQIHVSKIFKFEEIYMAHEAVEEGHTIGKIVIRV